MMKTLIVIVAFTFLANEGMTQTKKPETGSKVTGKSLYVQHCMKCHQADGAGAMNMIPPLVKTDFVLGSKASLIKIVLQGLKGEMKVNGDMYSGEMPPQASLSDQEIAILLTYIRNSFGNKASGVTSAEVKKIRSSKI